MFNALRNTIARIVAVKTSPAQQARDEVQAAYADALADKRQAQKAKVAQSMHRPVVARSVIAGNISYDQIAVLSSDRLKQAVGQLGAWLALSNAFTAYTQLHGQKRPNEKLQDRFTSCCNEFHQWNSRMEASGSGLDVEETVVRLTAPRVAKSNEQTDIILARIKGKSVLEIGLEREIKAELESKKKEELAVAFIAEVESMAYGEEGNPEMKASMVLAKAEETLLWVAGWTNPDIGELLMMEADINQLVSLCKAAEKREAGAGEGSRELDNMLLDSQSMKQGNAA